MFIYYILLVKGLRAKVGPIQFIVLGIIVLMCEINLFIVIHVLCLNSVLDAEERILLQKEHMNYNKENTINN